MISHTAITQKDTANDDHHDDSEPNARASRAFDHHDHHDAAAYAYADSSAFDDHDDDATARVNDSGMAHAIAA